MVFSPKINYELMVPLTIQGISRPLVLLFETYMVQLLYHFLSSHHVCIKQQKLKFW